eukprot:7348137-Prymnesium_polylepis.1
MRRQAAEGALRVHDVVAIELQLGVGGRAFEWRLLRVGIEGSSVRSGERGRRRRRLGAAGIHYLCHMRSTVPKPSDTVASDTSSVTSKPCGTKLPDPAAGASRPSPHRLARATGGGVGSVGGGNGGGCAALSAAADCTAGGARCSSDFAR